MKRKIPRSFRSPSNDDSTSDSLMLTPKQLRCLQFIRQSRLSKGYSPTMEELAEHMGVSKVTAFEHVEALIKKGAVIRRPNKARSLEVSWRAQLPHETSATRFPLVGVIAAGAPIEAVEDQATLDLEEMLAPPPGSTSAGSGAAGDSFALRVRGDSMIDEHIRDGDYVICRKTSHAHNGQTVVALLENGEATLKKFYKERDHIRLQPANQKYDPIIVKECRIQGIVVGLIRSC